MKCTRAIPTQYDHLSDSHKIVTCCITLIGACILPIQRIGTVGYCMIVSFYILIFLAGLMSDLWVSDKSVRKWILPRRAVGAVGSDGVQVMGCGHFQKKYDQIQRMISQIGCMDELLSGEQVILAKAYCIQKEVAIGQDYLEP